ncbi:MAG: hypothetical protein ACKV19_10850 [Verrucomicrobiales bacterium]
MSFQMPGGMAGRSGQQASGSEGTRWVRGRVHFSIFKMRPLVLSAMYSVPFGYVLAPLRHAVEGAIPLQLVGSRRIDEVEAEARCFAVVRNRIVSIDGGVGMIDNEISRAVFHELRVHFSAPAVNVGDALVVRSEESEVNLALAEEVGEVTANFPDEGLVFRELFVAVHVIHDEPECVGKGAPPAREHVAHGIRPQRIRVTFH